MRLDHCTGAMRVARHNHPVWWAAYERCLMLLPVGARMPIGQRLFADGLTKGEYRVRRASMIECRRPID